MNDDEIRKIFEHTMKSEGYSDSEYFDRYYTGQYMLSDIQELFRGFKLGWNAARYLAEIEIGIKCADAGQVRSSEDVKASWKNRQP